MFKDRLRPYVYMVEGPANVVFFDMLKGKLFNLSLQCDINELRNKLMEKELIFETDGIVPNKIIRTNLRDIQSKLQLGELQIRLNGRGEDNCWNRAKKQGEKRVMNSKILSAIISACEHFPVSRVRIEAEDKDDDQIEQIITGIACKMVQLNIENGCDEPDSGRYKALCNGRGIEFSLVEKKQPEKIKVEMNNFFYSQYYNPCLGHQVGIDAGGEIKPCLWFDDILGNITRDNLKDMVISGKFDKYWALPKTKFDTCKDCEMRFNCDDCRVFTLKETGRLLAKSAFCNYDPYTG